MSCQRRSHQQCRRLPFLTSSSTLVTCLFHNNHSDNVRRYLSVILTRISLMISDAEHLSMCLLTTVQSMLSLGNVYLGPLPIFKLNQYLCWWVVWVPYNNIPYQTHDVQAFPPFCRLHLCVDRFLCRAEVLLWRSLTCSFLAFVTCALGIKSQNLCQDRDWAFPLCFPLGVLQFLSSLSWLWCMI